MRGLIRRAAMVAGATALLTGSAVGVAAASAGPPVLAFTPPRTTTGR